jgi:hypothetical protein
VYFLGMSSRLSDGLLPVRLSALGTMFFLGASLGGALPVPWWVWFVVAVPMGLYMVLKFTLWLHTDDEDDDAGA